MYAHDPCVTIHYVQHRHSVRREAFKTTKLKVATEETVVAFIITAVIEGFSGKG